MPGRGRRGRNVVRAVVAVLVLGALPLVGPSGAGAQSVADAAEACDAASDAAGAESRACAGLERGTWLGAQHCRRVPPAREPVCPSIDGRPVHESAVQAYERGWVARALDLQRDLDLDVPLTEGLILHTHNSGNSTAYDPSLTINDANQVLSVTDQLRLGIRGIELDLHWVPNPAGRPEDGFRAVAQCHGRTQDTPAGPVHVGCSADRTFDQHLAELAEWLGRPEAAGELVVLYLENQLDQDPVAHDLAAASLKRHLGPFLIKPKESGGCQPLPVTETKRALLARGQVLVTGNCGPGGWTDVVFERGADWDESGSTTDYDCATDRKATDYATKFVRRYEDSTSLSLVANGGSYISPEVAASMVRCGVNFPGLDQVHPGDERLPAMVWSWRADADPDDPGAACAAQGDDGRFGALPCDTVLPVACRTAAGGWAPSSRAVAWAEGDAACRANGHPGAGVPANGWENEQLRSAAEGVGDVWLAYGRQRQADGSEAWTVGIPAPAPDDGGDPDDPDDRPGRQPVDPGRPSDPGRPGHAGPPGGAGRPAELAATRAAQSSGTPGAGPVLALGAVALVALAGVGRRRRSSPG